MRHQDSSGSPVVKTSSSAGASGSIPGHGAYISHALWPKKKKKQTETTI